MSTREDKVNLVDCFSGSLGKDLLSVERPIIDGMISDVFGFNAVQIGSPEYDFLAHSRIPNKFLMSEKIESLSYVPKEYREVGTTLHSENDKGEKQSFIVTRIDDETLTVDGNNPLCGRMVNFNLEILGVRDAVEEEIEAGGSIEKGPDIPDALTVPIH